MRFFRKRTGSSWLIFLQIIVLFLTACANEAQLVQEGNEAFDEAAYDEAVEAYAEAQQAAPELAEPIYNQANTRYRQEGLVEAEQLLQQALEAADPNLSQAAYYNLGNVHFNNQNWEAAIAAYQEALRLNPDDADARHNLELAMQQLAQQEEQEQQQEEEEQEEEEQGAEEQGSRGEEEQEQSEQDSGQEEEETADPNQPDESEEQQQDENTEQAADENEGEQSGTPLEAQELTADQARQLLEAIAQDAETLQEHLQQIYQAPAGTPGRDW